MHSPRAVGRRLARLATAISSEDIAWGRLMSSPPPEQVAWGEMPQTTIALNVCRIVFEMKGTQI